MKINGYTVSDIKLVIDGNCEMVKAERPCDCCLKSDAKIIKASLDGYPAPWVEVKVCKACLVKGGWFLSITDLNEEIEQVTGDRGRG